MSDTLIAKIREYLMSPQSRASSMMPKRPPFSPASKEAVEEAERSLGFQIPTLLKRCYLEIANGGFGPGCGVIGVKGGCAGDCGTLVECYESFTREDESSDEEWQEGLLPFCGWGCAMFS